MSQAPRQRKTMGFELSFNKQKDTDLLQSKLAYQEAINDIGKKEKANLIQEYEKAKYQLLKQYKDLEDNYLNKETELRRQTVILKKLESDYDRLKRLLNDEKNRSKGIQKQLDLCIQTVKDSLNYVNNFDEMQLKSVKDILVNLALVNKQQRKL